MTHSIFFTFFLSFINKLKSLIKVVVHSLKVEMKLTNELKLH